MELFIVDSIGVSVFKMKSLFLITLPFLALEASSTLAIPATKESDEHSEVEADEGTHSNVRRLLRPEKGNANSVSYML